MIELQRSMQISEILGSRIEFKEDGIRLMITQIKVLKLVNKNIEHPVKFKFQISKK
jgi:hypothetical protein